MKKLFVGMFMFLTIVLTACSPFDEVDDETAFEEYKDMILPLNDRVVEQLQSISETQNMAIQNNNLLLDNGYINLYQTQYDDLYDTLQEIKDLDIPNNSKIKNIHTLYLKAVDEYEYVSINAPIAIKNMDVDLFGKCSDALSVGGDYMKQATQLVKDMKSDF